MARWHVEARAFAVTLGLFGVALLVAMITEPVWTLRYERVLAWPVIVLIGIVVFRRNVGQLLQGRGLRNINVGPGGISAELEPDEQVESAALPATSDQVDTELVIVILGLVAQLYQFQIDFLKHVRQSESFRMTRVASEQWFRERLGSEDVVPDAEIERLLTFLVGRNLLTLQEDDHYAITDLAVTFIDRITGFWYAPKAY
jgi:hypothetical protein